MKKNSNYNEMIRVENEITKMKLQAEFGCDFSNTKKDLNPEIERMWLNNILEFERAAATNEKTTVGARLGNPVCRPVAEIGDDEIINEVQSLMDLMRKNNIVLDTIDDVDDREIYRFITEELVKEEMYFVPIPNMFVFYIYEEFHPNKDKDIRRRMGEFMKLLVTKEDNYIDNFFSAHNDEENEIRIQNMKRKLFLFRDAYDELRLENFNVSSVTIYDDNAEVNFDFQIDVLPPESKKFHPLSGSGKFLLVNKYGLWDLVEVEMEGVV